MRPPHGGSEVLYSERQRVPLTWWLLCAGVVAIIAWQAQMQRPWWWGAIAGVLAGAAATWMLLRLSTTRIAVVAQPDGQRWLHAGGAKIPARLISRALVIPPTAKQAAMGRQLDPAAYVVHHGWIPTMAMAVLDDPDDPTPYWLISTKDPDGLLAALDRPVY
ncbi:DUF3093 domain-containing protein [Corynebacterium heidelbergense]|uniref:DUF3093 domain-containing protein n=1 Tax=Corynebacterium heidelbergense TaxID=2055947 RepID=A0A364V3B1_9CORY|nr:DUF3093 domain-containing protein [Corynebacterium heidelbergense]RAV32295.1 DUF3093 domain-containing protein [Corynebacterium heidelbergense]